MSIGDQAGSLCCLKAELSGLRDRGPVLPLSFSIRGTLSQSDKEGKRAEQNLESRWKKKRGREKPALCWGRELLRHFACVESPPAQLHRAGRRLLINHNYCFFFISISLWQALLSFQRIPHRKSVASTAARMTKLYCHGRPSPQDNVPPAPAHYVLFVLYLKMAYRKKKKKDENGASSWASQLVTSDFYSERDFPRGRAKQTRGCGLWF